MNNHFRYHILYLAVILALLVFLFISKPENSALTTTSSIMADETFVTIKTNKSFEDAAEDAAFAISERNFRITNTLRIGNAIRERGREIFPENDVILFCNIQYAELMLDLDPDYVNYCPGQITLREVDENTVIISAPLVPKHNENSELNSLVDEVNRLITESVEFAAENWQDVTN